MRRIAILICLILLAGCGGGGDGAVSSVPPDPTLPFHVSSTSPTDNQAGVPVASAVTISFNREVDAATLAGGISAGSAAGALPGNVSYNASTRTVTFTPTTPLAPLTEYTVTVAASVRASDGEALAAPHTHRFTTLSAFWAYNFTIDPPSNPLYMIPATKVAEGVHCYIYVENGRTVTPSAINNLVTQFDTAIYPSIIASFGNEPNPGVDNLSKVFIVLMDILDGFQGSGGFTAGYFFSLNEESNVTTWPFGSNQKEVFFMDISPGDPSSPTIYKTLAHEFQHMVHWERKEQDITWLDEAMSEVAPFYAGYGGSYSRVFTFEQANNRSDSLTTWNSGLEDYAVAYMWAQYMADRFPDDVFSNILASPGTGIDSVNSYLASSFPGTNFSSVFRDWSIAVFSGNRTSWPGRPEWSYTTIDTWPGTYDGWLIPGMIKAANQNISTLPGLAAWSIDMYWYTSQSADPLLTWIAAGSPSASFYDWNTGGELTLTIPSGTYPYDNAAVLILQNASGSATPSSSTTNPVIAGTDPAVPSPAEKLRAAAQSEESGRSIAAIGEPTPVCMQDFLAQRAKAVRQAIREKRNAR